jgi:hypothetical protein
VTCKHRFLARQTVRLGSSQSLSTYKHMHTEDPSILCETDVGFGYVLFEAVSTLHDDNFEFSAMYRNMRRHIDECESQIGSL